MRDKMCPDCGSNITGQDQIRYAGKMRPHACWNGVTGIKGEEKRMRAVIVTGPTPKDWTEAEVNTDLKSLQRIVGGYIETLPIDSSKATVFCNEEGKLQGLPQKAILVNDAGNVFDIITGTFIILGPTDEEGEVTELTDEALTYAKQYIRPIYAE